MIYMKSCFLHEDYKGLKPWVDKHTVYAQRAAVDYIKRVKERETMSIKGLETGARIKRIIKYKVYYKLPTMFRARLLYIYCYYIRLGFLDGSEGRIFAFLHSYWYRYLVDAFILSGEMADQNGNPYNDKNRAG